MRILAAVLCVCVACFLFPCGIFAVADACGACAVSIRCGEGDGEIFEVVVEARAEDGICGVFGVMRYDAQRLILLSAGAVCGGAVFSFLDIGGEVRFLIDGVENVGGGVSVSLFFGRIEGARGEAEVAVLFAEAYCFSDGVIDELALDVPSEVVTIGETGSGRAEETELPTLISWEITERGGGAVLSASCCVGEGFFAAGVELFVVREDGSGVKMIVAGVVSLSGGGEFGLKVSLGEGDWYAAVITPVAFNRCGCVRGEKTVEVRGGE